jgi:hypothetical protein
MPHTDPDITRAALSRNALLVLEDAQGVAVAVDAGVIWLTLHNDTRDIFVNAGERFRIDRPGRTVIMAHEPASLRLIRPVRFRILRAIGAAIARTLRRTLQAPARRTVPYY